MYRIFKASFFVLFVGLVSGCANITPMPLSETAKSVNADQQGILFGRLTIKNENKPNHQPVLQVVGIKKDGEDLSFTKPMLISEVEDVSKEYLFSLTAKPGVAELGIMRFQRLAIIVNGSGTLPFDQEIVFPESGITYIGNIDVTIVPREEDQPRAGIVIPLIDQAVTGFSNGTYVVNVADNYAEDVRLLKNKFPGLQTQEVTKNILPSWVYPVARTK